MRTAFRFSKMQQSLGLVSLVVRDYDEALEFFLGKLGFDLVEDTPVPAQRKRLLQPNSLNRSWKP
ncbi:VOC family protein [Variovorax sp. WDL1]|uniref:VOC family protein n=2 Tax=unclassified Variovorax TaxID=663243 RepID=UPI00083951C7